MANDNDNEQAEQRSVFDEGQLLDTSKAKLPSWGYALIGIGGLLSVASLIRSIKE